MRSNNYLVLVSFKTKCTKCQVELRKCTFRLPAKTKKRKTDLEVVETVEEEAKVLELVEPDADLLLLQPVDEARQDGLVLLRVEVSVPVGQATRLGSFQI